MVKKTRDSNLDLALALFVVRGQMLERYGREPRDGDELFPGVEDRSGVIAKFASKLEPLNFDPFLIAAVRVGKWSPLIERFMAEHLPPDAEAEVARQYQAAEDEDDLDDEDDFEDEDITCLHLSFFHSDDAIMNAIDHMKAAFVERTVDEITDTGGDIEILDTNGEPAGRDESDPDAWSIHIHGDTSAVAVLLDSMEENRLAPRGILMVPTLDDAMAGDEWVDIDVVSREELQDALAGRIGQDVEGDIWAKHIVTQYGQSLYKWTGKLAAFANATDAHMAVSRKTPDELWFHFPSEESRAKFTALFEKNKAKDASGLSIGKPSDPKDLGEIIAPLDPKGASAFFEEYAKTLSLLSAQPGGSAN
jgi:hypothetical protein